MKITFEMECAALAAYAADKAGTAMRSAIKAIAPLILDEAVKIAEKHQARTPDHNPDVPGLDLVAHGYGNAAFNIGIELRMLAARALGAKDTKP